MAAKWQQKGWEEEPGAGCSPSLSAGSSPLAFALQQEGWERTGVSPATGSGCARLFQAHKPRRSSLMALAGKEEGFEDEMLGSVPCCDSIQPKGSLEGWRRNVV